MPKLINVFKKKDKWCVKKSDKTRVSKTFTTQAQAKKFARKAAIGTQKQCDVVIHNKKGRIREKNSYNGDPRTIPG